MAVVTGASSGIGLETAKAVAAAGWRVIGQGRDPQRSAMAAVAISAAAGAAGRADMLTADLSELRDTARLADQIAALTDRIDVLINNAGGLVPIHRLTAEGLEVTFAGNYLGHFLLTKRLLPSLRAAAAIRPPGAVRVINTSSSGHAAAPGLEWDDLQALNGFDPGMAYNRATLAVLLFTRALAKRRAVDGILVHAVHPGLVDSGFFRHDDLVMKRFREENKRLLLTPEEGADTLIWLATANGRGRPNGGYFQARAVIEPSLAARDDAAAERLWRESEALIARVGL